MLTKIDRQDTIKKFPKLPLRHYHPKEDEFVYAFPKTFSGYVLTLPSKSFKGHVNMLSIQITDLTKHLRADKLIFLGDIDIPWLQQNHDFKQAKEGLQYLASKKVGKKFNGAVQVDTSELPTFIKHLVWLVRTNAVLPYVHFIDPKQNIIGTICQYGNIHIWTVNRRADKQLKEAVSETLFGYLTENCYNRFSKKSAIKGRQITI
ncbi:MAG TPA: hypothetical protein VF487_00490 [Chitinophagaceae bacterium]